jgi:hypothetical protein
MLNRTEYLVPEPNKSRRLKFKCKALNSRSRVDRTHPDRHTHAQLILQAPTYDPGRGEW